MTIGTKTRKSRETGSGHNARKGRQRLWKNRRCRVEPGEFLGQEKCSYSSSLSIPCSTIVEISERRRKWLKCSIKADLGFRQTAAKQKTATFCCSSKCGCSSKCSSESTNQRIRSSSQNKCSSQKFYCTYLTNYI